MEAWPRGRPDIAHSAAAGGHRGSAVFPAFDHRSAVASLVCAPLQGALPYRLYALSNAGSMFALVSYPVLFEPWLGTRHQALSWSWAYVVFVLLCVATAFSVRNATSSAVIVGRPTVRNSDRSRTYLFWIALPACASVLLLAITNHLTQNVAAIPFLWILPLSLYLLSFILCFEGTRWYRRKMFLGLFAVAVVEHGVCAWPGVSEWPDQGHDPLVRGGPVYLLHGLPRGVGALEAASQPADHLLRDDRAGRRARRRIRRPGCAPLFHGFYELPLGLAACMVLVFSCLRADPESEFAGPWKRPAPIGAALLALAVAGYVGFVIQQRGQACVDGAQLLWRLEGCGRHRRR